jgi:hypothetical protein
MDPDAVDRHETTHGWVAPLGLACPDDAGKREACQEAGRSEEYGTQAGGP